MDLDLVKAKFITVLAAASRASRLESILNVAQRLPLVLSSAAALLDDLLSILREALPLFDVRTLSCPS
jgi:hypothetical protein